MSQKQSTRRKVLIGVGTAAVAGAIGVATGHESHNSSEEGETSTPESTGNEPNRETFTIMAGTEFETTGYVIRGDDQGPTTMVISGIHGNETAGFTAAKAIAEQSIAAGTLVVLPKANRPAIEADTRTVSEFDLNRQFPTGEPPENELASAIWDIVEQFEPTALIDLHESQGLFEDEPTDKESEQGFGQAIFHSDDEAATTAAERAAAFVNAGSIPESLPAHDFEVDEFDVDPMGLLAHKFARDTDGSGFIVETDFSEVDLEQRVAWHRTIVGQLLNEFNLC